MPQDVNASPEGNMPFEEGQVPVDRMSDAERPEAPVTPERAVERGSETAHEKYRDILSKVSPKKKTASDDDDDTDVDVDAQSVYSEVDAESRVSKLLSLAESKSPEYAVRVAIKLNDLYVLDRMHDEMAEQFYNALVKKGVIKE
jgi:hypothetical protein